VNSGLLELTKLKFISSKKREKLEVLSRAIHVGGLKTSSIRDGVLKNKGHHMNNLKSEKENL